MSPELDAYLCRKFPLLYADRHQPMDRTSMCWGFEIGDGWYQIIRDLSGKLEPLIADLPEEEQRATRACQVKEKFGTLRFYMTSETDAMSDAISRAERRTETTCESCGGDGEPNRDGGWVKTRCPGCRDAG